MIRHICFDKDGVLIDAHHYWSCVIRERASALADRSGTDIDPASIAAAMGIDVARDRISRGGPVGYEPRSVVAQAAGDALSGVDGASLSVERIEAIFGEIDRTTATRLQEWCRPIDGAKEAIDALATDGYALSVATSDRTALARDTLRATGLDTAFGSIVGADRVAHPKPDPESILLACKEIDATPEESAYVGDTLGDMRAARSAGVLAIGVTTGLATASELSEVADHVISGLGALGAIT